MIFIFAFIFSFGFQFSAQASDLLEASVPGGNCQISLTNQMGSNQVGLSESRFLELIDLYQYKLKARALELTRNPDDAKDLLQDTYMNLWAYRERIIDGNFKSLAMKIMFNRFVHNYRRQRRHQHHEEIDSVPESFFVADIGGQESRVAATEMANVFSTLPPHKQKALLDIVFHEINYDEAAPTYRLTTGGLKVLVNRARKALQGKYPD